MIRIFALLTGVWTLIAGAAIGEPLRVFAAASLNDALEDLAEGWSGEVVASYGGSGGIARQIALGAPADVVILANTDWLDWLAEQGVLRAGSMTAVAANRLVLIGPADAPDLERADAPGLIGRLAGRRMAVGQVLSVPAGIYAKEWMQTSDLWEALVPHLAETENVRAALALVERAETPLGVVYASDAQAGHVRVLHEIDPGLHGPIRYGAAVVDSSSHPEADDFLRFILSDGQAILKNYGFLPVADG